MGYATDGQLPRDTNGAPAEGVYVPGVGTVAQQGANVGTDAQGTNYAASVVTTASGSTTAISATNTGLPVNTPVIVQKASNVSASSVTTLAKAFTSSNTTGNTIVVLCGAGNNGALTVTDSAGNTYTQAKLVANSTTFEAAIFYAVGIAAGANTVTVTNGGAASSMALEIYEVSGLLAQVSAQPDQATSGTGTSATPTLSAIAASSPNSIAFLGIAVGTAAQATSVTSGTSWTLDSTQNAGGTPSGLFSFGALSQYLGNTTPVIPTATIAGSEPFAAVAAIFKPVSVGMSGTVTIGGYNYTRVTTAATTLVKTGPGILHAIVVNKPTSTATIEVDDALTNTTPIIGILGAFAASIAPFTVVYDVAFSTGLSVTVGVATVDATIVWK